MATDIPTGLASLAVGLLGVVLARWVFVNREQRRLGRKERRQETLPVTLVGILVTGVIINDRGLGLSSAAFVGLGVGWATVLLLEVMGTRIQQFFEVMLGSRMGAASAPPPARAPHQGAKDWGVDPLYHNLDEVSDGGPSLAPLVESLHQDEEPGKKEQGQ